MDLARLITEAKARHAELVAEAAAVSQALVTSPGVSEALRCRFEAFRGAFVFHVQREERFLFTAALAALEDEDDAPAALAETAETLGLEHVEMHSLSHAVSRCAAEAGPIGARVVAFLDRVMAHHDAEDTTLFPALRALDLPRRMHA